MCEALWYQVMHVHLFSAVDTEDYLQPVSVRGSQSTPVVDDDGYLHPHQTGGYIDVIASEDKCM